MRIPLGLLLLFAAGCASSHELPPGIRPCPLLVLGAGESMVSYGALAGDSSAFVPGTCVAIYVDDERVARTVVTSERTFAVQFQVRGDARDRALELRLGDDDGRQTVQRYSLDLPERLAARIAYEPGTRPLVARAGDELEFTGWLARGRGAAEISDVWMVNWSRGAVESILPTPRLDEPFTGRVSGGPGECASPVSAHVADFGGCWWPRGGAGCAPPCTEEDLLAGLCSGAFGEGPCTQPRGCEILDVDERHSGAPEPELAEEISTIPPDGGPDAGPPDGGRRDDPGLM